MPKSICHINTTRWLTFIITLCGMGLGLWLLFINPPPESTQSHTPADKPHASPSPDQELKNGNHKRTNKQRHDKHISPAVKRGPHNRLLFQPARTVERPTIQGKVFAENILNVRKHPPLGKLTLSKHSSSAVEAEFDPAVINRFVASQASILKLPIDGRRSVEIEIEKVITRGPVTHTLVGKIINEPLSQVILVAHDGAVSGSVALYDANNHYEYAMAGNGDVAIRTIDPSTYTAGCGNPGTHHDAGDKNIDQDALQQPPNNSAPGISSEEPQEDATVVMDTIVGYGTAAMNAQGGAAAIEALIMQSVDRLNTAFDNSLIGGTAVELLGTIQDPDYVYPGAISDNMGSADELGDLNNASDGSLDTITDFKTAMGADTACFVVKEADGSAGIAYRPGSSMIVARTYMSSNRITYAHEFGHNIGCQHAWGDTSSAASTASHNYGWRIDPPGSSKVRSIMSYDWGWTRIPYFSNPNVLYNGARTGAVNGYDATGDTTADPRAVSGGYTGNAGSGYDGTHSNLGARNADYIFTHAPFVADNADRPLPEIAVEQVVGVGLSDNADTVNFTVESLAKNSVRSFTIRNVGQAQLSGLSVTKSGAHSADFSIGSLGLVTLAPGASTTFNATFSPGTLGDRVANIHIASNDADENPFDITLSGTVSPVITEESFENGLNGWGRMPGHHFNWSIGTGFTLSTNTGPSAASDGTYYIFTESSSPNYPGKTAGIQKTFDFTGRSNIDLNFDYHMYGNTMGSLHVDVFDGTWHSNVWSVTGQQHSSVNNPWKTEVVDLSNYDNQSGIIIRFRGVTGSSYKSDIAVDNIALRSTPDYQAYVDWAALAGLTGDDAQPEAIPFDDEISNLIKYAFNMSGAAADRRNLVPGTGITGLPVVYESTNGSSPVFRFEYIRRKSSGLNYTAQTSSSLDENTWVTATQTITSADTSNPEWERQIIEIPITGGPGKLFFRVQVLKE